jgi:glycosyltransferase involved in cell wall biosynthesis
VVTCHGFFRPHLWRKLVPLWGKRVIAISEQVKGHLINDFKLAPERIRLIYNGIALGKLTGETFRGAEERENTRREIKKSLGLNAGPVVGIIARLCEVKGHRYLIEAIREIVREFPAVQLLIVGDGREKQNLIRQVKDAGVEKNIIFKTSTENTETTLAAMDLFVLPSLQEGLGLSLMEAMAQGLAVVATDVGGIPNLIRDGFNGSLVKARDSHALASAIKALLEDDQKAKAFGANARQTITADFSLEKMIEDTERVYLECLGQND